MVAVSARIFLPGDLAAPAPIEDPNALSQRGSTESVTATIPSGMIIAQFYPVVSDEDNDTAQNGWWIMSGLYP